MEKKEPKKVFRQPANKDASTDLTSLKKLGFREVEPPDTVTVFFPMSRWEVSEIVSDEEVE
jgi:hypothetical protein